MKVGDLVKHNEDNVFGLIIEGPISYEEHPDTPAKDRWLPRFRVKWGDMRSGCDELGEDMTIVSSTCKKVQNNLNISE